MSSMVMVRGITLHFLIIIRRRFSILEEGLQQCKATADVSFGFIKQGFKEGKDQYIAIFTSRQFCKNRQIVPRYVVQMVKEKGDGWREDVKIKTSYS